MTCIFCERLLPSNLCIFEQELTKTYVNYNQAAKGLVIVMLKQHIEDESLLSEEQKAKFFQEVTKAGQILKTIYKAQRINYMLLGNEVPHLHFHVLPRTKKSIKKHFFPKEFFDKKRLTPKQEQKLAKKLKQKFEEICSK